MKTILKISILIVTTSTVCSCAIPFLRGRYTFTPKNKEFHIKLDYDSVNDRVTKNLEDIHIPGEWFEYEVGKRVSKFKSGWVKSGKMEHNITIFIYETNKENETLLTYEHLYREAGKVQLDYALGIPFPSSESKSFRDMEMEVEKRDKQTMWEIRKEATDIPTDLEIHILAYLHEFITQ